MGGCCGCLKFCAKRKKSRYGNLDQFEVDVSLTQGLIENENEDCENKSNEFITPQERELIKNKNYKELRRLQKQQDLDALNQLALQESELSRTEETRFEKERQSFGVEIDLDGEETHYSLERRNNLTTTTSVPLHAVNGDAAKSGTSQMNQQSPPPPLHTTKNVVTIVDTDTNKKAAAVEQDNSKSHRVQQNPKMDSTSSNRTTIENRGDGGSKISYEFANTWSGVGTGGLSDGGDCTPGGSTSVQHVSEFSDDEDEIWTNEFISAIDSMTTTNDNSFVTDGSSLKQNTHSSSTTT